jgi:serine/threonine-protein kinase
MVDEDIIGTDDSVIWALLGVVSATKNAPATRPKALPRFAGYDVLSKINSGGMGEILLARKQSRHDREKLRVVKTIRTELRDRDEHRAMFLDEARLLGRLDHPCIAQLTDFGESDGQMYLAMEYIAGVTFWDLLKDKSITLPATTSARLISEACRGLHAAHELSDASGHSMGVVHRDVSPANLMFSFAGAVKVLDFGIALTRDRRAPETEIGFTKGKLSYMAPEQRRGDAIDRRTDVYALSVVLWELLTRQRLFTTDMVRRDGWEDRASNVPKPSSIAGPLPSGLDEVVLKGLAVDPADRFQDAREMQVALEQIIDPAGGEALATFAERELEARRRAHDSKLQALTALSARPSVESPVELATRLLPRKKAEPRLLARALLILVLITVATIVYLVPREARAPAKLESAKLEHGFTDVIQPVVVETAIEASRGR